MGEKRVLKCIVGVHICISRHGGEIGSGGRGGFATHPRAGFGAGEGGERKGGRGGWYGQIIFIFREKREILKSTISSKVR